MSSRPASTSFRSSSRTAKARRLGQAKASSRRALQETVGTLRDLATCRRTAGRKRKRTLYTTRIHFKHVVTTLGEGFPLSDLTHASLQQHINRRASGGLAPATIKKEIATLRASWNWGRRNELVEVEWPGRGLVYRKTREKPPFQTRDEIERQLKPGGLTARPEGKSPAGRGSTSSGARSTSCSKWSVPPRPIRGSTRWSAPQLIPEPGVRS